MPPGRRTTRSTMYSQQFQSTVDTSINVPNIERVTRSTVQNPRVVGTTRSPIHVQQVDKIARPIVQSQQGNATTHSSCKQIGPTTQPSVQLEQVRPTTRSTARIEQQPSIVQIEQGNMTAPSVSEDDIISSQKQSEKKIPHNPRKATRGMGTSKIAKAASSGKLSVIFDADCRQPICTNAEKFNNEIGFIVRNHSTFHYKEWRLVPEEVRAPLRHYLLENFDTDLCDETTIKCIDEQMRKAWRGHRYKLHSYFKDIGGEHDLERAKKKRHPDLKDDQQKDWEILCDRWSTLEFKERSLKNINNRTKRKWDSKNGSVSTPRHHIRRGMALTSLTGQIETWRQKHFDENGWTGPDLEKLHDEMMVVRDIYSPEEMSDKQIMESVLGRSSVYLRGWGRSVSGATNKSKYSTGTQPNLPSYQEIVEQLNEANNRVREVVEILRHNNLMPPPSVPSTSPTNEASGANLENSG